MKNRLVLAVLLSVLVIVCSCEDNPFDPGGWRTVTHQGFTMRYRIQDSDLEVELEGPSTGWVAVGFDGAYLMHDANIIIGYVSGTSVNIRDDFGIDSYTHVSDSDLQGGEQNVFDKSGSEDSGTTTISFSTPLDSGDLYDNPLSQGNSYTLLFICGNDGADDFTSGYKTITTTSFNL